MKIFSILLAVILCLCLSQQFAVAEPEAPQTEVSPQTELTFRVQVVVETFGDEPLKSNITSFVNRELRSLGDVVIVESNPAYRLFVVGVKNQLTDERVVGFTLNISVTCPVDVKFLKLLWSAYIRNKFSNVMSENEITELVNFLVSYFELWDFEHTIFGYGSTLPSDRLRNGCEALVARFDSEVLEPARKSAQSYKDSVNPDEP